MYKERDLELEADIKKHLLQYAGKALLFGGVAIAGALSAAVNIFNAGQMYTLKWICDENNKRESDLFGNDASDKAEP